MANNIVVKFTACILDYNSCDDVIINFESKYLPPDNGFYADLEKAVKNQLGEYCDFQLLSFTTEL